MAGVLFFTYFYKASYGIIVSKFPAFEQLRQISDAEQQL